MKHFVFPVIIFALSFSAFSQDTKKKWNFEASLTPTYSFSNYTADIDIPIHHFYADLSQNNEVHPHITLGGSVQTSYWITNSLRVSSGINYTAYGERYHTTLFDQAPTVYEVYTQRLHITNHYLGIPISLSTDFLKKEKTSFFATFGCNFEFLLFKSEVHSYELVNHANMTKTKSRNSIFRSRKELFDQNLGYNGFSPTLFASFGVTVDTGSKSQLRIGPQASYMLIPHQEFIAKHYFFNVGLNVTYVFAK